MKRFIVLAVLAAFCGQAMAAYTFDVYANNNSLQLNPLDTGLYLEAGDILQITAAEDDLWSAGSGTRISNADGLGPDNAYGGNYGLYTYNGFSFYYGSLVGQIGGGDYFLVGTSFNQAVADTGNLKLMYWDSNYADNSDYVSAITTVIDVVNPVPAPGAILLGGLGTGLVSWLRRRQSL